MIDTTACKYKENEGVEERVEFDPCLDEDDEGRRNQLRMPTLSVGHRACFAQSRYLGGYPKNTVALFGFLGGSQYRIEFVDRLPHLGTSNPRVPLRHPQIPVSQLACD